MVAYEETPPEERQRIDSLMNEIDLADSNSIIFFGSKAQQELTSISDNMLEGVRNKDVGSAGTALNQMVTVLRGFEIENFDPNAKPGFFARLWRKLFGGITTSRTCAINAQTRAESGEVAFHDRQNATDFLVARLLH